MKSIEAEAGSIDDAIEKALDRLGVSREQAEIEILSNATRGLFGLGGKKAVVRATLRAPLDATATAESEAPAPPVGGEESGRGRAPRPPRRERRPAPPAGADLDGEDSAAERVLDPQTLEQAREVLAETVRLMQTEATVRIVDAAEGTELCIEGDSSGLLIGRRGQTLDALEYVINRVASRDAGESAHLVVDSQGYRARRRESLRDLARRLAARARKQGTAVPMNPMSPRDRRIVHLALKDDPSIQTRSSGKGHFRTVMIVPSGARRAHR